MKRTKAMIRPGFPRNTRLAVVALLALGLLATGWALSRWLRPTSRPTTALLGTIPMAERLEKIAREADPAQNVFLNRQRAELFRARLSQARSALARVDLRIRMSLELLRAGAVEEAIRELSATQPLLSELSDQDRGQFATELDRFLALSYLRLGEQENCVAHHTSHSCLLPLSQEGVHEVQRGSRAAIEYFTKLLTQNPADVESAWLLNIAYMTLGAYPQEVPPQWLVPPRVFQSEYDIGRFADVAPAAGVAATGRAGGALMDDFDGDGLLDIVRSSWGLRDQLRFFRNTGDGTFADRTREAGLEGIVGGLNLIQADYDNDGRRDILVLRGAWLGEQGRHPNSLLRNQGDGTFVDVTESAGLLSFHPTQTAVWADFDSDGWLDLFIGNESDDQHKHPCEIYRNNGHGTFTECAAAWGVAHVGFVKGVSAGDYDNDGRPDLYLSCFGEPNVLLRNGGPVAGKSNGAAPVWRFENVTRQAGVAEPRDSFPTWFFDFDNDGWQDLFVASYSAEASMVKVAADYLGLADNPGERPRLYRNNRDGTFSDLTKACQLDKVLVVMGCNFGDLDNDGWLDLYLGTGDPVLSSLMPNRMFRNHGGKGFQDVTTSGGFGHIQKGHGVAFGDLDNDGDQDIYITIGGAYEGDAFQSALFQNPGHGHRWVTLHLQGVRSNRDAIGARFEVKTREKALTRTIHGMVSSGGSFGGSSLQQEIGLGPADAIESITIRWPFAGASAQVVTNVSLNGAVEIIEGQPGWRVLPQKRFDLSAKP